MTQIRPATAWCGLPALLWALVGAPFSRVMSTERRPWQSLLKRFDVVLLGCCVFGTGAAGQVASAAEDTPPVLVATTGGAGAKWPTVAELIAAADRGDPLACFQYAQLLEEGSPANQVPKSGTKAIAYYEKAGTAGHGPALFRLGKIFADGLAGAVADYPRAYAYYLNAAQRGVAEGQYNVGAMLVSARGVKRDYVEGLAWLLVAKNHGAEAEAGIAQVRKRLEKWPQRIAAAEARAAAIEKELASPTPAATRPPAAEPGSPAAPKRIQPIETPKVAPPRVPVEPPAITPPTLDLPPPPPSGKR